jgi:hypothetical protein
MALTGTATPYGLDGPGIESRYGRVSFLPLQSSPRAHEASFTLGTGSLPGWSGRDVASAVSKERVEIHFSFPSVPS